MGKPEVLIARAAERFDAAGRLTDEPTRRHLERFLAAFAVWIRRFAGRLRPDFVDSREPARRGCVSDSRGPPYGARYEHEEVSVSPKTARLSVSLAILGLAALPALADMRIEKTLKLAPGGEFRLDTDMGKVTLVGSADADAHVVITSRRKDLDELLSFKFDESAGLVSITARQKHKFDWFSSSGNNVAYEVRVPAQTRVWIDTSGGGITVSGIRGEVKTDTSGGGISVTDVEGDVDADTSGGGITLRDIRGNVRADTSGGGVEATGITGSVRAESSGGSIELERVSGDIDADTSGGGISILEAGGRVVADTSGGGIEATLRPRQLARRLALDLGRRHRGDDRPGRGPRDRGLGQRGQDGPSARRPRRDLAGKPLGHARQGRQHPAPPHERGIGPHPVAVGRRR